MTPSRRPWRGTWVALVALATVLFLVPLASGSSHGSPAATPSAPSFSDLSTGSFGDVGLVPAASVPNAPSWPAGVIRTFFPYYHAWVPGNFRGAVDQWQVGAPAFLPNSSVVWWPQLPVRSGALPVPPLGPTLVYNASNGSVVGLSSTVTNASALAVDPSRPVLWVAWALNHTVEGFWLSNFSRATSPLPTGTDPVALAVDPVAHHLFVADRGSNTVTVVDSASGFLVDQGIAVGSEPCALASDAPDGLVYVANANSSNLTVLRSASPASAHGSVGLFNGPAVSIAYSAAAGTVVAVEPASKYLTMVAAASQTVIPFAVVIGTGADAVVSNLNGSEFVVANGSGASLRTVGSSSPFVVSATAIPTGPAPSVLAVDPANGSLLVWSSGNRTIEQVNLSSGNVTSISPTLGPVPTGLLWDPTTETLLVADPAVPAVERLDPVSGELVGPPIALPSGPSGIALGPAGATIYAAYGDNVGAFNATTGASLGAVSFSGTAGPLLVDAASGLLWAGDAGNSTVVGLGLANLSVTVSTGRLTVDASEPNALALDPGTDTVFAVNTSDANSIATFDGSNGSALGPNLFTGPNVTALAFDAADGLVYAAGDALAAVDPSTDSVVLSGVSLPSPASVASIVYDPLHAALLVRSVDRAQGSWITVVDGRSAAHANESELRLVAGLGNGSLAFASPVGAMSGAGTLFAANAASGTVSVLGSPPSAGPFLLTPSTIDLGMAAEGQVLGSGGAGSLSVVPSFPSGCLLGSNFSVRCVPTSAGSFVLSVNLTDAYGESAVAEASLTVHLPLALTAGVVDPASTFVDEATVLTFLAGAQYGTAPYTFRWTFGDGATATGPLVYHAYNTTGAFAPWVSVTDALGSSVVEALSVTVAPAPSVRIVGPSAPLDTDVGLSVPLNANASGGTGPGSVAWAFGDGATGVGVSLVHSWTHAGVFSINVTYTDAGGVVAHSSAAIDVHPRLTGEFQATTSGGTARPGTPVQFVAVPAGGSGSPTALWSFGDGSFGNGTSVLHAYGRPGNYSVNVTLRDSAGGSVSESLVVEVDPASSVAAAPPASQPVPMLALGLVVGGTVAAVALYLAERSKHRPRVRPPTAYEPPSPAAPKGK